MADYNKTLEKLKIDGFKIKEYDQFSSTSSLKFILICKDQKEFLTSEEALQMLCLKPQMTEDNLIQYIKAKVNEKEVENISNLESSQEFIRIILRNKYSTTTDQRTSINMGPIVLECALFNGEKLEPITMQHLEKWKIGFQTCLKIAKKNMQDNIITEEKNGSFLVAYKGDSEKDISAAGFLITNELAELAREKNTSLIILPSSQNEIVAIPTKRDEILPPIIAAMTKVLQETNLTIENALSNDLFYYDNIDDSYYFGKYKISVNKIQTEYFGESNENNN